MKEKNAEEWMALYYNEIPPEELISEEEKQKLFNGTWPKPIEVEDMGIFIDIKDGNSFNKIVGNPSNWPIIRNRPDLFEKWIVPHAVIFFGKLWFDKHKYKASISKGIPFALFTEDERSEDIDNSFAGKARISKIVEKISIVMRTYVEGKWFIDTIKSPSGYVINSLKNEFIREIGIDRGYKFNSILTCPLCLCASPPIKTPLKNISDNLYSCPRCSSILRNLDLKISSLENGPEKTEFIKQKENRKHFSRFLGITCICPTNNCPGKFVPISCFDKRYKFYNIKGALKDFRINKNIQLFQLPPKKMLDFHLTCPFCETNFTPRKALDQKTGFKNKSGFFTGLPSTKIWIKQESPTLEEGEINNKNLIAANSIQVDTKIIINQRLNLLIGELLILTEKTKTNTINELISKLFFISVIRWIIKYDNDANNYFFGFLNGERDLTKAEKNKCGYDTKKTTTKTRGKMVPVYQSIFSIWIQLIEENIELFTKRNRKIKSLKDIPWFCCPPKFSGGPVTKFYSKVKNNEIENKTPIRDITKVKPRLVKIYSIKKDNVDYINDVKEVRWQSIKLKDFALREGDEVLVSGLIMSGHPTHAPIQRILRLRSVLLKNIISKILEEEKTGQSDVGFWKFWRSKVEKAKRNVGFYDLK